MGSSHRSIAPWRARPERAPHEDESLNGYLAFRAAKERLPTVTPITSLAGTRYGHRPDVALSGEGLDEIGDCLQVEPGVLAARVHPVVSEDGHGQRRWFFGVPLDRRLIGHYVRSFSPAALARSPHHRAIWCVRPLPFCTERWEVLTDLCPSRHCGARQSWLRTNGIDRCDSCAASLLDAPVERVPDEIRSSLRLLAGMIHPDPARRAMSLARLPEQVQEMGPGPVFELAVAVAGFVDPDLRASHHARLLRSDAPPLAVCRAMAEAWTILSRWPDGLEQRAADALAERVGRFGDGNRGATVDLLRLSRSEAAPVELTATLSALDARLRANRHLGLDCKTAAAATGLRPTRVVELRRAGVLPAIFHLDGERAHPLIAGDAVARLADQLRGTVEMGAAAVTLGIPRYGVEQLAHLGLLEVVQVDATSSGLNVPRISRGSLERLAAQVAAAGRAKTDGTRHPLATALGGLPGHKPWGRAVAAVTQGTIGCFVEEGDEPLATRVMLDDPGRMRLRALRCEPADGQSSHFAVMSKKDAAEVLNLHARHALPLLDRWLTPEDREAAVPVAEVVALADAYVSTAELCSMLRMQPTALRHEAQRMGLKRASQAGFRRTDVAATLRRAKVESSRKPDSPPRAQCRYSGGGPP